MTPSTHEGRDGRGADLFAELSPPYSTIVADPPWDYGSTFTPKLAGEEWQKGAECPYSVMTVEEISDLPVRSIAAKDAHLYLWTTNRHMEQAHQIARSWGFQPKTILTWGKVRQDDPEQPSMKVGHWFRSATEHVVFERSLRNAEMFVESAWQSVEKALVTGRDHFPPTTSRGGEGG